MASLNPETGRGVSGLEEVQQSIRTILQTWKGTRVMRRDFGSDVPRYIDSPLTESTVLAIYAATVDAISRNEPRFLPTSVRVEADHDTGKFDLYVTGLYNELTEVELSAITIG